MRRTTRFFFAAAALAVGATGCELIANVDRSQIDNSPDAGDASSSSSSSSSSGIGGKGGSGGVAGMGGAGGSGGIAGMGGAGGSGGIAGMGGAGGAGGIAGMGGTGGSGMPCQTPADCTPTMNECIVATCNGNVCGTMLVTAGTPVAAQIDNDCKVNQCDGAGNVVSANDDNDLPVDQKECTMDVCKDGVGSNPPLMTGEACGAGMALFCDGMGACVGCNAPADCGGMDTECQTRTCVGGACGVSNAPQGTVLQTQTSNDCATAICDGMGGLSSTFNGGDLPADDNNACTVGACDMAQGPVQNPVSPNDNNACTTDACDPMTGVSNTPISPNDNNACTADTCNPMTGVSNTPISPNDNNACTMDSCDPMTGVSNTPISPNDNNACTTDTCNPMTGVSNTPISPNDNNACTADACDPVTGVSNTPISPNDNNACTTDTCNPMTGVSNTPISPNDNNACTADACDPMTGVSNTPISPNDNNACTADACDPVTGVSNTPISPNDNNACTADACDPMTGVSNTPISPNDNNACTADACDPVTGVSNTNLPAGTACNQNGGTSCDGNGNCIMPPQCTVPGDCPGMDTECQVRTCNGQMCGFNFTAAGTPVASQTPGNCQVNQCNGSGAIESVADNADVPADDGNECTNDTCSAGVPVHPPKAIDTACTSGGGSFCNATGQCVQCNAPIQCGADTACQTRSCNAGTCGVNNVPNGTVIANPTAGDCQSSQCDGAGNITPNAVDDTDRPVDGNQCTDDVCTMGVPTNPPSLPGSACMQGGVLCDGAGSCVQCIGANDCPGMDTECQVRTCISGSCGFNFAPPGTPTSGQMVGDCRQNQCDGAGSTVNAPNDADLPVDGNQCTSDICTMGAPSNPPTGAGTPCSMGGTQCDGNGTCFTPVAVTVVSTTPADGATPDASSTIAVTFSTAMNGTTLTGQTTAGACTGSIQVSLDNFASCIAFSSATATMSAGDTVATLTPAPGMLINRNHKIRVTTAAMSSSGTPLDMQTTQPNGFLTKNPLASSSGVVISQVYGGGGNAGSVYKNDFIELHNRGPVAVDVSGWAVQYTSGNGAGTWTVTAIPAGKIIQPGGYFLVQEAVGTGGTDNLPTPDVTGTIAMGGTAGKVALTNTSTALTGQCPSGAALVDFVGYGAAGSVNCSEGSATGATATLVSNTTSAARNLNACNDSNVNNADFTTATVAPAGPNIARNSATAAFWCSAAQNESNAAAEADYCNVQFPLSLSPQTGMSTGLIYGRVFEMGTTGGGTVKPNMLAQLGWGAASANPQYQAGWTWINASINGAFNMSPNDEYQASFTAPAPGIYRYAYRFSLDQGVTWTVCDQNLGDFGAGSNPNLEFTFDNMPVMTVLP